MNIGGIVVLSFFIIFFGGPFWSVYDLQNRCTEYYGEGWTAGYGCNCIKDVIKELCIDGTSICENRTVQECRTLMWVDKE